MSVITSTFCHYADDTHLYVLFSPENPEAAIKDWMISSFLQLNSEKTEALLNGLMFVSFLYIWPLFESMSYFMVWYFPFTCDPAWNSSCENKLTYLLTSYYL